jgi:hypothetical protein
MQARANIFFYQQFIAILMKRLEKSYAMLTLTTLGHFYTIK